MSRPLSARLLLWRLLLRWLLRRRLLAGHATCGLHLVQGCHGSVCIGAARRGRVPAAATEQLLQLQHLLALLLLLLLVLLLLLLVLLLLQHCVQLRDHVRWLLLLRVRGLLLLMVLRLYLQLLQPLLQLLRRVLVLLLLLLLRRAVLHAGHGEGHPRRPRLPWLALRLPLLRPTELPQQH